MTVVLLVVVGVVLVGLPLVAVLADRVLPPTRNRPVRVGPEDEVRRRFALLPNQFDEVEHAVHRGRVAPEALRPAALTLAELRLRPPTFRGKQLPLLPLPLVAAVGAALLVAYGVAVAVATGNPLFPLAYVLVFGWQGVSALRRRSLTRRAAAVNRPGHVPAEPGP